MADERDFELLDDFLTNRMSEQERSAFEQKLKADPDLQHEYGVQKRLIEGIKEARIAELKSMLNNVAVPAGNAGNALTSKILLGTAVGLMIVAAAVWYFNEDATQVSDQKAKSEQQVPLDTSESTQSESETTIQDQKSTDSEEQVVETDKNQTSAGTEQSKPSLAKKPDPLSAPTDKADKTEKDGPVLDVFTPDNEEKSAVDDDAEKRRAPALTPGKSSLVVETDRNNRRYSFHYQFRDGKLFLYGPFEKNLYEIMEFFTDEKRTVFLFYKEQYFLLQEADNQVRPLAPISDPALIKKLKEYRNSK